MPLAENDNVLHEYPPFDNLFTPKIIDSNSKIFHNLLPDDYIREMDDSGLAWVCFNHFSIISIAI